jgi:hypothetical protein
LQDFPLTVGQFFLFRWRIGVVAADTRR